MTSRRARATIALLCAAGVALGAVSVISPSASAAPAKADVTLTITVLPGQQRLLPDAPVTLGLSPNRTTGHSGAPKGTGDRSAVTVSKGVYTAPNTDLVGAPGRTVWTITARDTGTAVVKFMATPPGGGAPVNDGSLTLIVQ